MSRPRQPNDSGARRGAAGWNMWVFRDGRETVSGPEMLGALSRSLERLCTEDGVVEALLRSGELECALADAKHGGAREMAALTDRLATLLLDGAAASTDWRDLLPAEVPARLELSPPEGFAYYALHPKDFADLAASLSLRSKSALVIGIRSIGTTLSAIVTAALQRLGVETLRMSVRPHSHPYDRRCDFDHEQAVLIDSLRERGTEFFVVDEGPGISGSSFLSVADALVRAGVPRERVTLLCSREPDVDQLRAPNGPARWREYRAYHVVPSGRIPQDAKLYAGAGEWRRHFIADQCDWPESWLHMERLKFLSGGKRTLFKFEGHGRFGRTVHERAVILHNGGFGPPVLDPQMGYGVYPVVGGTALRTADATPAVLRHIARYCAFRSREFRTALPHAPQAIARMARHNIGQEFGREIQLSTEDFASRSPVIADARMHPREWLRTHDGRIFKLDGTTHGDDHFFPGPCDIAWDLAGTIVEWELTPEQSDLLLAEYREASGDDVCARIDAHVLAYSAFRMAFCKMGAEAVEGSGEEFRMRRAYEKYRSITERLLAPAFSLRDSVA